MILVLSQHDDASTVKVLQWLKFWRVPYYRLDKEDSFKIIRFQIRQDGVPDVVLERQDGVIFDLTKVKASWYRRGDINFSIPSIDSVDNERLRKSLYYFMLDELRCVRGYIYKYLESIPHIGTVITRDLNKLHVLSEAGSLGLRIPRTMIESSKVNIESNSFVTKAISESFDFDFDGNRYLSYTSRVNLELVPESFFPTLFQEEIVKEADIRVFYLCGEFYSMAILSQENPQTITDFRRYPSQLRNRTLPFKLPDLIEEKLRVLMKRLELDTGSIDIVLDRTGEFYFLEVNPVGQYDMVSVPCNYYLHRKLAEKLIEISRYG